MFWLMLKYMRTNEGERESEKIDREKKNKEGMKKSGQRDPLLH